MVKRVDVEEEQAQQGQDLSFNINEVNAIKFLFYKADGANIISESPSIKAKCEAIIKIVEFQQIMAQKEAEDKKRQGAYPLCG